MVPNHEARWATAPTTLSEVDRSAALVAGISALGQPCCCLYCLVRIAALPLPLPLPSILSHVSNHRFLVHWQYSSQLDSSYVAYANIKSTFTCDTFCSSHLVLTGHSSVLQSKDFDPRARPPSERPSHAAVSLSELPLLGNPMTPTKHRRHRNRHHRECDSSM